MQRVLQEKMSKGFSKYFIKKTPFAAFVRQKTFFDGLTLFFHYFQYVDVVVRSDY